VELIAPVTARLIVNQVALKLSRDRIQPLLESIGRAVSALPAEQNAEPQTSVLHAAGL
jgi:hypothetical protein